jgi:hypothetical protein
MKKIILVLALFAPSMISANNYQGIRYATTEGKVYEHLSGQFSVAASTVSASTYTITLNGTGGVITAVKVNITTTSASSDSLCFAGAHAALPTTGYARGCILYLTTDPTKIYISTEAVTKTQSWLGK